MQQLMGNGGGGSSAPNLGNLYNRTSGNAGSLNKYYPTPTNIAPNQASTPQPYYNGASSHALFHASGEYNTRNSNNVIPSYPTTTTARPIADSTNSGYTAWQNAQPSNKSTTSIAPYKVDGNGRPIYNGTAASRHAQDGFDAGHASAHALLTSNAPAVQTHQPMSGIAPYKVDGNGRPIYNGTAASRHAQDGFDAGHASAHALLTSNAPAVQTHQPMSGADSSWYNAYSGSLVNGNADTSQYQHYLNLQNQYGLKNYTMSDSKLHDMSIKALSGDVNAQNYLKATHQNQQTAQQGLWSGYTPDKLNAGSPALRAAYLNANPTSDYAKNYDTQNYNNYNKMIQNNQPMSQSQRDWYQNTAQQWGLADNTNPLVQNKTQLQTDKTGALQAQDVATNNDLATAYSNNFQALQKTQQDMTNKGLNGSGMMDNAMLQSQMAANQNYQKAYADAATNKANISGQYDTQINAANTAINDANVAAANTAYQHQQDELKNQTQQDQWLTAQTGNIWMNGKVLSGSNGQPITTLDWQKMSETQRHDMATEANTAAGNGINAQKVANDYNLGVMNNNTANAKIAADTSIANAKLQYDYKNLDFSKQKWQQDVSDTTRKLDIAQQQANTASDKNALGAINSEIKAAQNDVIATQKSGTPAEQKKAQSRLEQALGKADAFISGKAQ